MAAVSPDSPDGSAAGQVHFRGSNRSELFACYNEKNFRYQPIPSVSPCESILALIGSYSNKGNEQIVAHESPRTTKLYSRTADAIILDEVERIVI